MRAGEHLHMFYRDWEAIYRYNGGLTAFLKCLNGALSFRKGLQAPGPGFRPRVDCVTFSVVPKMTALWIFFIERAITTRPIQVYIGDCSGGFHRTNLDLPIKVIPLLNYQHGEKIDMFLNKICTADYVIISDDDIFCLDEVPWNWALSQLESNPDIAAVSLIPRSQISSVLKDKVAQPMGSYCLILRRKIWMRENLSFKIIYPPPAEGYDWFYDTADYANLELIKRGYKIAIVPPEVRAHLIEFTGISHWILKIQRRSGYIQKSIVDIDIRKKKALGTILVARGLAKLIAEYYPHKLKPQLVPDYLLDRAQEVCEQLLPREEIYDIRNEIDSKLAKIKERLTSITQIKP